MSVMFIHQGGEKMASFRYRSQIPALELEKLGVKTCINGGEGDIVIFSKPIPADLKLANDAKSAGAKVVVDIIDDHLSKPKVAPLYKQMIDLAEHIVVPSEIMREKIKAFIDRDATVIGDAYEEEERIPHAQGDHLLWFGHNLNLDELTPWYAHVKPWNMRIITGPYLPETDIPTIQWTPENMAEAFEWGNVALLPHRPGSEYKTPNRLVNAIRAGLFPVCGPHPAYREFRKMVWVGDVRTGLKWVKAFPDILNDLVKEAQDYVRDRFSPKLVGQQWKTMLERLSA